MKTKFDRTTWTEKPASQVKDKGMEGSSGGQWLRAGLTVYELVQDGFRRGEPVMVNRWTAHVQPGRGCDEQEARRIARLIAAAPALLEALRAAEQFISNGIELGFIRLPDPTTPDSAHYTLPKIRAAISQATAPSDAHLSASPSGSGSQRGGGE